MFAPNPRHLEPKSQSRHTLPEAHHARKTAASNEKQEHWHGRGRSSSIVKIPLCRFSVFHDNSKNFSKIFHDMLTWGEYQTLDRAGILY